MINQVKKSKFKKTVAIYLAMMILLETFHPMTMYALTSGPTQPEFSAFTPIGTSDMVDLSSGDFNYNIPIMDVGGYPLNLAYNSGVNMDQEATWVGLGWNLNVGQIDRQVRGLPDDFKGDQVTYENNLKKRFTLGFSFRTNVQLIGFEAAGSQQAAISHPADSSGTVGVNANAAINVEYSNYSGTSITPSYGVSFRLSEEVSVGANLTTSATEGVSISPNASYSVKNKGNKDSENGLSAAVGLSYNSRQGVQSFNLTGSAYKVNSKYKFTRSGAMNFNFLDNTFTPTIRDEYITKSGTFNFSLGPSFWGADVETGASAYFSSQKIKDGLKNQKTYGYEYTHFATDADLLDFNRENDRSVTKTTRILPVTNYTYDVYNIQSQGMSGSFRPYSGQVGYVFDPAKRDDSYSGSGGIEAEFGVGAHSGVDVEYTKSNVNAGLWNTAAASYFKPDVANKIDYEEKYYKLSSDFTLDNEMGLYKDKLGADRAMRFDLLGITALNNKYAVKSLTDKVLIDKKIKRSIREKRNQSIEKITKIESIGDNFIKINSNDFAKDHHTAAVKVLNENGSTYVFGESVYNITKQEISFAVSKTALPLTSSNGDDKTGLIGYSPNEASMNNTNGIDNYFNRVTTPAYSSTFLLTSVLSADYEDISGDGPTDDDLGMYTKFVYKNAENNYQWRAPYYKASYNPGFNTDPNHKRASYTYGIKESKYISKIITKTHVAIFTLSERKDGQGVGVSNQSGEHNQSRNINSTSKMYKIDKIELYSKPEAILAKLLDDDASNDVPGITAIKTAHFVYDYSLCKGIDNNNLVQVGTNNISELDNQGGKLTLKKIFFTYRNSNMGKYTPYVFNYDEANNPSYDMKSFDVWGNYKKSEGTGRMYPFDVISSVEFPYVKQNKLEADKNTASWNLKTIKLPSGGQITIDTESDDYQFVQDKLAMQMFKVVGAMKEDQNSFDPAADNTSLFNPGSYRNENEANRLVIEVDQLYTTATSSTFFEKYIGDNIDKPIFFRFMLNMIKNGAVNYDYVEGYFKINKNIGFQFFNPGNGKFYAAIPMQLNDMEGGFNGGKDVNPISKAGWYFGRQNMNKAVYGGQPDPSSESVLDIINSIGANFGAILEIFKGPNGKLRNDKQCAQSFIPSKSWIRLLSPERKKLGGGCRVKSVRLSDKWDQMLEGTTSGGSNLNTMEYGQVYDYTLEGVTSSGVATYEPLGAKDNPLIEPFYDQGVKLIAPKEVSYIEKPFGQSFFPSPMVTYSKVTVRNLPREIIATNKVVKKHATGSVVNEFYTSKDFPTITDFTDIKTAKSNPSAPIGFLQQLLGVPVIDEKQLTLSQGFSVETNDMNGKERSQKVYDENRNLISGVDYNYSIGTDNKLNNNLTVIDSKGNISKSLIGMNYDVINDFRQNNSQTQIIGAKGNLASIPFPFVPPLIVIIPLLIPSYASHSAEVRMATVTKVVHKKGIMVEKIAYDSGASVSTKNLAWDANSGQVLLTETVNEYDDHYYSFTYPAYWKYDGMGLASNNIGINGELTRTKLCEIDPTPFFKVTDDLALNPSPNNSLVNLSQYFMVGDELMLREKSDPSKISKVWVVGISGDNKGLLLMDRNGKYIDDCGENVTSYTFRLSRSGYRNMQSASMASVTSMINPLRNDDANASNPLGTLKPRLDNNLFQYQGSGSNPRIINASAVVYKDYWKPQDEVALPTYPIIAGQDPQTSPEISYPLNIGYNPFVFNTKGDWRAERSYAYLGGRNATPVSSTAKNNPRNEGFFSTFNPFYSVSSAGVWSASDANWTYASSVSQMSPYGQELENEDALHRYSAAQYGYKYTLPMAVASNSKYSEMGFEGFEETTANAKKHFGFKQGNTFAPLNNLQSHTGRNSVKVSKALPVKLIRKLTPKIRIAEGQECSYSCNDLIEIDTIPPFLRINSTRKYIVKPKCSTGFKITSNFPPSDSISTGNYEIFGDELTNGSLMLTFNGFVDSPPLDPAVIEINPITIIIKINDVDYFLEYTQPSKTDTNLGLGQTTPLYMYNTGWLSCPTVVVEPCSVIPLPNSSPASCQVTSGGNITGTNSLNFAFATSDAIEVLETAVQDVPNSPNSHSLYANATVTPRKLSVCASTNTNNGITDSSTVKGYVKIRLNGQIRYMQFNIQNSVLTYIIGGCVKTRPF